MPRLTVDFFLQILKEDLPNFREKRFLLAASGGPDSMVLANLIHKTGLNFSLIHINYNLRGEDSLLDSQTVFDFAKSHSVKLFQKEISAAERKTARNIQIWARKIRYDFFRKIQQEEGFDFVLTAHHLDDNLETFFINLSRGSGLKGLAGIPRLTDWLYRPLLDFPRSEILSYAEENGVKFRLDASNEKDDYLRNRIRHHLTPIVKEIRPNFLEKFSESLNYLSQAQEFISEKLTEKKQQLIQKIGKTEIISLPVFLQESPFVRFEILRSYGYQNETENAKILTARSGSVFYSQEWEVLKTPEALHFRRKENHDENFQEIILPPQDFPNYKVQNYLPNLPQHQREWQFESQLSQPLILRQPKPGDTFQPLGLKGRKKISKFLRDEKISVFERENIWVLTDSNGQILGIIPLRQDGRLARKNGEVKIRF